MALNDISDSYDVLRKRWLNRYLKVERSSDVKLRTALIQTAEDASTELAKLSSNQTFSAGVKSAQLRLSVAIVKEVLDDLYKKELKIITQGQKDSANVAVTAFSETDRNLLSRAFADSGTNTTVDSFISGQRYQAAISVAHLASRIHKSDQPLSIRVYKTRRLANLWVKNQLNSAIARGSSAKELSMVVRRSIRPNTPGGVAYASMRLARTEINNAFHATSVALAQDRPWVESMAWNLSKVHEIGDDDTKIEICERYARQKSFEVNNVPKKPHPNCRCFVTPEVETLEVFVRHLTAGQYKDWIDNAA